jgi:hypothetical protein
MSSHVNETTRADLPQLVADLHRLRHAASSGEVYCLLDPIRRRGFDPFSECRDTAPMIVGRLTIRGKERPEGHVP